MSTILEDDSIMPYGVHKGKTMANVPDNYLIFIYQNNRCSKNVKEYIEDNLDSLGIKKID